MEVLLDPNNHYTDQTEQTQTVGVSFGRSEQKTIPMTSYRFGSWPVAISRWPRTKEDLVSQYDAASHNWNRIAQRYGLDAAYRKPLIASDAQSAFAKGGSDGQVLDCGIDSGSLSIALNSILLERPAFHGIDLSSEMLAAAGRELRQIGATPELKQADILSISYANDSFDLVMGAHVLEPLPEPRRALEEMFRVLKPGGPLFVCLTRRSNFGALIQLRWRTWTITEPQGVLWLEACGFEDIKSQPANFGSHAGAATIALWGRRPASKRQDPQTENADRKTRLVA